MFELIGKLIARIQWWTSWFVVFFNPSIMRENIRYENGQYVAMDETMNEYGRYDRLVIAQRSLFCYVKWVLR